MRDNLGNQGFLISLSSNVNVFIMLSFCECVHRWCQIGITVIKFGLGLEKSVQIRNKNVLNL